MFISFILEGEDSPNYKTILKEHVLYLSITNQDAFLQSMVYWNLNQYQQALNCLLNDIHSDEFAVRSLLPLFISRSQKCRFLIPSPIFTLPVLVTTSQFLPQIRKHPSNTPRSNTWVTATCYIERRAGLYYKSLETIGHGKGLLYQYTYYMIINCMRSKLIDSEFVAKEQFEDYIESIYKDLVFLCTNNQIPLVSIIENNTVTACSSHTYSLSSLFALLDRLPDHNIAYLDTCYNLILKIIVKHLYAILGGLKYNPLQVGTYPKFLLYKTQSFLLYLYEHQSQRI